MTDAPPMAGVDQCDEDLARRIRDADSTGERHRVFQILYERHWPRLVPKLTQMLRESGVTDAVGYAEEVAQVALHKAYVAITERKYDPDRGGFVPYLWAIAKNEAVSAYRRCKARLDGRNNRGMLDEQMPGRDDDAPLVRLLRAENVAKVRAVLVRLNQADALFLRMRYIEGLTMDKITEGLGLTAGQYRSLQQKSTAAFRGKWSEMYGESAD